MFGRDHRPRDYDEVHREQNLRRAVAALEAPHREDAVRPPRCEPYIYAAMMLVAGQVAAVPFVAAIPSM